MLSHGTSATWLFILLVCFSGRCYSAAAPGGGAAHWSYNDHHEGGPSTWGKSFPDCGKLSQSPIDIRTDTAKLTEDFDEFVFSDSYVTVNASSKYRLSNNGHTIQLSLTSGDLYVTGGGLPGKYKLAQFHAHWGSTDDKGSEHTVNGKSYPLELHFVHYNADNFTAAGDAMPIKNGLAVLGVFAEIGDKSHPTLENLLRSFTAVKYKGTDDVTITPFKMADLLPAYKQNFVRYSGSLTTPPCYESVIWTVFQRPIKISKTQLNAFRTLNHEDNSSSVNSPLHDNYRPVQLLNKRPVYRTYAIETSCKQNDGKKPSNAAAITPAILLVTFHILWVSYFI